MTVLLDTNVLSESTKAVPDAIVTAWLAGRLREETFVSTITIAELVDGIERMAPGSKQRGLQDWLNLEVVDAFEGHILGIDVPIARVCGGLMAKLHRNKVRAATNDIWIAAIALHHGMTIATRNTRDFDGLGVPTVDPWQSQE